MSEDRPRRWQIADDDDVVLISRLGQPQVDRPTVPRVAGDPAIGHLQIREPAQRTEQKVLLRAWLTFEIKHTTTAFQHIDKRDLYIIACQRFSLLSRHANLHAISPWLRRDDWYGH